MVYNKIREIKFREKKPVTLKWIHAELDNKMTRNEIAQALRELQENGEISLVAGPEPSYDLY